MASFLIYQCQTNHASLDKNRRSSFSTLYRAQLLLAVTNDKIRPPNKVQNRRNKQSFDTYTFTIGIIPLVLEKTCFAGHTFEYKWKTKQKAQNRKRKAEMSNKRNGETHLHATTWAEHHRGKGLGLPRPPTAASQAHSPSAVACLHA